MQHTSVCDITEARICRSEDTLHSSSPSCFPLFHPCHYQLQRQDISREMLSFFPEAYSLSGLGRKARQDLFHDPSQPPEWNLVSDRPGHRKNTIQKFQ